MSFGNSSTSDDADNVCVQFNQDSTSLAVGTKNGLKLYELKEIEKLNLLYEDSEYTEVFIVERLFSSSLLAVVSLSSPRTINLCHFKRNQQIMKHSYHNTILAVKLNRKRLVVCLEESILIHNMIDLLLLHTIKQTARNPKGIIALAPTDDRCFLAYPAKNTTGEVNIFDAQKLENKLTIVAHDNPIVSLAFDSLGYKLATASERGTVIRVFNTNNGDSIYEFRRGFARCVTIYSLSFSADSLFLCASSDTETVHIFKLNETRPQEDLKDMVKSFVQRFFEASHFNSVADMMNQGRSFATAQLPLHGSKTVATITNYNKSPMVLIASHGYLYVYDLNINEGGNCTLIRQHRLIDQQGNQENSTSNVNNLLK